MPKEHETCPNCGQIDEGQTGEHLCSVCGLPWLHDEPEEPGRGWFLFADNPLDSKMIDWVKDSIKTAEL